VRSLIALVLVTSATAVSGQTNDQLFRSWRWTEDVTTPRAAGMAGAFVAVADDSSATFMNPAGLLLLPKTELAAGFHDRASGSISPPGDQLRSRRAVGFIGGAGLIARRFAIGGYITVPHDTRLLLASGPPLDDSGYLDATVTNAGGAVSWRATSRIYVGGRINVTHLRLQGLLSHRTGGSEDFRVGLAAGEDRVTGDAGLLIQLSDRVRVGARFRQGAAWPIDRRAQNPAQGVDLDSSPSAIRSPSAFSAGVGFRWTPQILLTGQLDYVLYGQIRSSLDIRKGAFARSDYVLSNGLEPRIGVEFSRRAGPVSLQLRGGVHTQAPGSLRYVGADPLEAAAFPGSKRRTLGALGASVVTRLGLRLDTAWSLGGDRIELTAGVALRF